MVQVIERKDIGEEIGKGLGQSSADVLKTLLQSKLKRAEGREKLKNLMEYFGGESSQGGLEAQGSYSPAQLIALESQFPGAAKIIQEERKAQKGVEEEVERKTRLQGAINNMLKVLPSVGPGNVGNLLTKEGRTRRQYFNSLAMNLEEIAATMVGKGTLSKPRFEFLLKNLPSASKTQAANEGALRAWSETLGADIPYFQQNPLIEEQQEKATFSPGEETVSATQEIEEIPRAKKGEVLSKETAKIILKKAKGNKEQARKIARKYGYNL